MNLSSRLNTSVGSYQLGLRKGTYWGIRTDIGDYKLPTAMDCPFEKTSVLANTPTRLKKFDGSLQERIINWGFGVCDVDHRNSPESCFTETQRLSISKCGSLIRQPGHCVFFLMVALRPGDAARNCGIKL